MSAVARSHGRSPWHDAHDDLLDLFRDYLTRPPAPQKPDLPFDLTIGQVTAAGNLGKWVAKDFHLTPRADETVFEYLWRFQEAKKAVDEMLIGMLAPPEYADTDEEIPF